MTSTPQVEGTRLFVWGGTTALVKGGLSYNVFTSFAYEYDNASDSGKVTIFFVSQSATSPLLNLAYQAVSDFKNISSSWIEESKLIATQQKKEVGTFYVLASFSGNAYSFLRNVGCRIFGPHVILNYIREGKPLPNWQLPLFSGAMRSSVVTFSSVTGEQRQNLTERVRMMHGEVTGDFTVSVNVIVTSNVGSKKYLVGHQVGVAVVRPEWIEESWKISAIQDPFDAMSVSFLTKFKVPTFLNLVICVSGLSMEAREDASRLIEANGGRYSKDLKVGECTHLVVDKPSGDKYHYAKRWKVQIVTSKWLSDSIDKGYSQDEANYKVEDNSSCPQGYSTPEERPAKRAKLAPPDISIIGKPNISRIGESRFISEDVSFRAPDNTDGSLGRCGSLSGCIIASIGRVSRRDELNKKVGDLGGRMCDTSVEALSEEVTHVLVGDPSSLKPEHLQFEAGIHVVKLQWLLDCIDQNKRIDETDYIVKINNPSRKEVEEEKENISMNSSKKGGGETPTLKNKEKSRIDADELAMINQYFEKCDTDEFQAENTQKIADDLPVSTMDVDATTVEDESEKMGVFGNSRIFFHESAKSLAPEFYQRLRKLLDDVGTTIIDSSVDSADYCVTHFFASNIPDLNSSKSVSKPQFVTLAWIYSCLEKNEVDKNSLGFLAYPLKANGHEDEGILQSVLENSVLCVSGYTGALRTCLCLYAEALGARMQEGLMRRAIPDRNIKASTHLVCAEPCGQKFEAAKRWGIPIVRKEWLFACAKSRRRLSESDFDLEKESMEIPDSEDKSFSSVEPITPLGSKPTTGGFLTPAGLPPRRVTNLTKAADPTESPRAGMDTPGKFLTEGVQFRPRFDLQSLEDMLMKTPDNARELTTPVTEKVNRGLSNAVRLSKIKSPVRPMEIEEKPAPLAGIVIYVAKKISGKQCELNNMVKQLGGQYKWSYDRSLVTHMIFEGSPTDELREAKKDKKFIVHPAWVYACNEKSDRISETLYPSDYKPVMSLEITSSYNSQTRVQSQESQSPSASMIHTSVGSAMKTKPISGTAVDMSDVNTNTEGQLKFEVNFSSTMTSSGNRLSSEINPNHSLGNESVDRRRSSTDNRTVTSDNQSCEILNNLDQHLESSASAGGKRRRRRRSDSVQDTKESVETDKKQQECDTEDQIHPSQSLQVHWRYDDSDGHTLSAGHHQPSLSSSCSSVTHSPTPPAQPSAPRIIMLSGFSDPDRQRLAALITKHNATMLDSRDPSELATVTHLVVEKPTRGEKFMTCVAAGKWVVHRAFVECASVASGWPSEERHEWGGAGTEPALIGMQQLERGLARAAKRWRIAGGRAFDKWRVIFYSGSERASQSKIDSFKRILEAGGAEVLATQSPYPNPQSVTHAFVEFRRGGNVNPEDLPDGFVWLKHEFLSALLIDEREPDKKDYLVIDKTKQSDVAASSRTESTKSSTTKRSVSAIQDVEPRMTRASKRLRRK